MKKQRWIALCAAASFATAAPLSAVIPPVYAAEQSVQLGSQNDSVTTLQNDLKQLGYLQTTPTGYFDSATLSAVKAFQAAQGLTVDGIVGPITWAAMTAAMSASSTGSTATGLTAGTSSSSSGSYTFSQKSIVLNGKPVLNLMRIVHNGTTYMPVWYLEQALKQLNIQTTWSGTAWALTLPSSVKPDLSNIKLGSGSTAISLNGTVVSEITGIVYRDPNDPNINTTYVPIYYLQAVLSRIGVQSNWDGQTWTLTSGQTPGSGSATGTTTGTSSGSGDASSTPGSTTPRSPSYQLTKKAIVLNGTPVMNVMRLVSNGTTYMPVWYLMESLKRVNIQSKWSGTAWALTLPSSVKPDLSNIQLGSGKTEVSLNGTVVSRITGIVYRDPYDPQVLTTYLPIYYLHAVLLRAGVQTTWDGQTWTLTTTQTGFNTYDSTGKLLNNYTTEADAQAAITSIPGAVVKDATGTVVYTEPDFAAYGKTGTLIGNYTTQTDAQAQLTSDPGGTVKDLVNGSTVVYTEPDFAAYDKSGTLIGDYTTEVAAQTQLASDPGGTVKDMVNGGTVVYTVPDFAAYTAPDKAPTDYVMKTAAQSAIYGQPNGYVVNVTLGTVINQPSNVYRLDSSGLWTSSAYGYLGTVVPPFAKSGAVYLVIDNSNSPYMSKFFYLSQNGKYVGQNVGTFENPFRTADLRFSAPSSVTADQIDTWLGSHDSPLQGLGSTFLQAQNTYGVNATYLVAHAIEETGWGRSLIAQQKNNLFGYGAFDSNPGPDAGVFPSNEYAVLYQAYYVRNSYLNPGASFYYNWSTLDGMNERYATSHTWSTSISNLMNEYVDQTGGSISSYMQYSATNTAPNPSSSTEPVFLMNGATGQVLSNPSTNLSVYVTPSANSSVGSLPVGTAVTIDSMQMGWGGTYVTEWYHVTAGTVTGWVDSAYVGFTNVYRAVASSAYSVPIYGIESTASTPVDTIHTGDYVVSASATPDANGFYTVQMANQATGQDYTGYISSASVSLVAMN